MHTSRTPSVVGVILVVGLAFLTTACSAFTSSNAPSTSGNGVLAPVPGLTMTAVSCPTANRCLAGGTNPGATSSRLVAVQTTGATPTSVGGPAAGTLEVGAIGCPTAKVCIISGRSAVDSSSISLEAHPSAFTALATSAPRSGGVTAMSCPDGTTCIALINHTLAITSDLGAHWATFGQVPATLEPVWALSCPTPFTCVAAGGRLMTATKADAAVAVITNPPTAPAHTMIVGTAGPATGITCNNKGHCLLIGITTPSLTMPPASNGWVEVSSTAGSTWSSPIAIDLTSALAVSCASSKRCVAVGNQAATGAGAALTSGDGGNSWSQVSLRFVADPLAAVSCPKIKSCTAVGGSSIVSFDPTR